MDNLTLPQRHDWVAFDYKGKSFKGEVRRVYDKPKGHLMIVKLGEGKYRSCYLEQCENLTTTPTETEA
jgi:hypothetical protein